MSDGPEALTDAQIEELRQDLLRLRARLTAQLERAEESAATVELDQPIGRLSRVDALARIAEGEYGYCLRTGEPIGYRRLKVRPETPLSIEGQAALERRR